MGQGGYLLVLVIITGAVAGQERAWLDAHEREISFASDDEILEYLATARIVSETPLADGVNRATKLLLEKDGLELHAVFREVEIERKNTRIETRILPVFRDSHRYEVAAYALSRLLGLNSIPPVTLRQIDRRRGSVQLWIQRTVDETAPDFSPRRAAEWVRQLWNMYLFDNLVYNIDRNSGNVLVDADQKIWMIDHTRAFQLVPELLDESVMRVERSLWDRLVALSDDEIRLAMEPHLDAAEIENLLERRARLVEHVRKLVVTRGENVVFY